jgi:hypothetical protein
MFFCLCADTCFTEHAADDHLQQPVGSAIMALVLPQPLAG